MKVSREKYLDGVESIYVEQPAYALGHDGSDGKCDCIGMPRGSLERAGATDVKHMSGTNMAARKAIENLREITTAAQLELGEVVLKVRDKDDASMPLPDRYRKGGADYDAKLGETNFTHIGTVTSVDPLVITHMTSPTAQKDTKIGRWTWAGKLPWVDYGGGGGGDEKRGIVTAPTGSSVNLRKAPSRSAALIERIPVGSVCTIHKEQGEWDRITTCGRTGWMMAQYIRPDGGEPGRTYTVTISGLDFETAKEISDRYPGSRMEEEQG